jgi:hypothetical protein
VAADQFLYGRTAHHIMSEWGRCTYGDPCRECGFDWAISTGEAKAFVAGLVGSELASRRRDEHHPDLDWSVTACVAHIGDNLRIWADRLAGIMRRGGTGVATYDVNVLAAARSYDRPALPSVLWPSRKMGRPP